ERHAKNDSRVALARQKELAGPHVPQPRRIVITHRGQPRRVGAERHTMKSSGVALALPKELTGPCVPQACRAAACCSYESPVRAERDLLNASMAVKSKDAAPVLAGQMVPFPPAELRRHRLQAFARKRHVVVGPRHLCQQHVAGGQLILGLTL